MNQSKGGDVEPRKVGVAACGLPRHLPLVARYDPEPELAGSNPIFWLQHDGVRIERNGPRIEKRKAALPASLFRE